VIEKLSEETQGVLYQFNKNKMNQFFEHQENLVLFRHFLAICKDYFMALHNLANPQDAQSPDAKL